MDENRNSIPNGNNYEKLFDVLKSRGCNPVGLTRDDLKENGLGLKEDQEGAMFFLFFDNAYVAHLMNSGEVLVEYRLDLLLSCFEPDSTGEATSFLGLLREVNELNTTSLQTKLHLTTDAEGVSVYFRHVFALDVQEDDFFRGFSLHLLTLDKVVADFLKKAPFKLPEDSVYMTLAKAEVERMK